MRFNTFEGQHPSTETTEKDQYQAIEAFLDTVNEKHSELKQALEQSSREARETNHQDDGNLDQWKLPHTPDVGLSSQAYNGIGELLRASQSPNLRGDLENDVIQQRRFTSYLNTPGVKEFFESNGVDTSKLLQKTPISDPRETL